MSELDDDLSDLNMDDFDFVLELEQDLTDGASATQHHMPNSMTTWTKPWKV